MACAVLVFSGEFGLAPYISKNVRLGVVCSLAKFHAFIIKVNSSLYFLSITADNVQNSDGSELE